MCVTWASVKRMMLQLEILEVNLIFLLGNTVNDIIYLFIYLFIAEIKSENLFGIYIMFKNIIKNHNVIWFWFSILNQDVPADFLLPTKTIWNSGMCKFYITGLHSNSYYTMSRVYRTWYPCAYFIHCKIN